MNQYTPDTVRTLLNQGQWFHHLPDDLQSALLAHGKIRPLSRGSTLFARGDAPCGLYAALKGALRISMMSEDGKEAILTFIDPPNWIGEVSLFDGQPRTHDAIAENDCILWHVPQAPLAALLDASPAYWRHLGLLLTQKLRLTFYAIEDFALLPAPQRLIRRLVLIAQGYGTRQGAEPHTIRLQQEQLGRMLSISRQTTNQILKDLESQHLIQRVYGGIEILDLQRLQQLGNLPAQDSPPADH